LPGRLVDHGPRGRLNLAPVSFELESRNRIAVASGSIFKPVFRLAAPRTQRLRRSHSLPAEVRACPKNYLGMASGPRDMQSTTIQRTTERAGANPAKPLVFDVPSKRSAS
jgi:hypothetical protein